MQETSLTAREKAWIEKISTPIKVFRNVRELLLLFNNDEFVEFVRKSPAAQDAIRKFLSEKIPEMKVDQVQSLKEIAENKVLRTLLRELNPPCFFPLTFSNNQIPGPQKPKQNANTETKAYDLTNFRDFIRAFQDSPEILLLLDPKTIKFLIVKKGVFHDFFVKNLEEFIEKFGFRSFFERISGYGRPERDFAIFSKNGFLKIEPPPQYLLSLLLPLVPHYPLEKGTQREQLFCEDFVLGKCFLLFNIDDDLVFEALNWCFKYRIRTSMASLLFKTFNAASVKNETQKVEFNPLDNLERTFQFLNDFLIVKEPTESKRNQTIFLFILKMYAEVLVRFFSLENPNSTNWHQVTQEVEKIKKNIRWLKQNNNNEEDFQLAVKQLCDGLKSFSEIQLSSQPANHRIICSAETIILFAAGECSFFSPNLAEKITKLSNYLKEYIRLIKLCWPYCGLGYLKVILELLKVLTTQYQLQSVFLPDRIENIFSAWGWDKDLKGLNQYIVRAYFESFQEDFSLFRFFIENFEQNFVFPSDFIEGVFSEIEHQFCNHQIGFEPVTKKLYKSEEPLAFENSIWQSLESLKAFYHLIKKAPLEIQSSIFSQMAEKILVEEFSYDADTRLFIEKVDLVSPVDKAAMTSEETEEQKKVQKLRFALAYPFLRIALGLLGEKLVELGRQDSIPHEQQTLWNFLNSACNKDAFSYPKFKGEIDVLLQLDLEILEMMVKINFDPSLTFRVSPILQWKQKSEEELKKKDGEIIKLEEELKKQGLIVKGLDEKTKMLEKKAEFLEMQISKSGVQVNEEDNDEGENNRPFNFF